MARIVLNIAAVGARWLPGPVKRAVYGYRPLAQLIRRMLNRAAPQGQSIVEVAAGGLEGMRLALDLQTEKDFWLGTYEPELQAALLELVQPGMVVYDVGANIGYMTLLCLRRLQGTGRVYAFEALPANQERLHTNLALNDMTAQAEVVPVAIVDQARTVRFLVGPSGEMGKVEGSAGRNKAAYGEPIPVDGISLDKFVYEDSNPPPQVIKMDIEGGEVLAFPGMQRLLRDAQPLVLLELHGPQAAQVSWTALVEAGYQICSMAPGYPGVPSLEALDWKSYVIGMPVNDGSRE